MRAYLSMILVAAVLTLSSNSVQAMPRMLSTMNVVEAVTTTEQKEKIIDFLHQEKVQQQMTRMGVDPQEALRRVAALSPSEIQGLSQQMEKGTAGGDLGVGSIVGAAVFVFLVLLITDILGYTKIFPFTRSIR
ncbi:MAG TPA: PA2779 family protein [Bacteriovoracaceae bacterium]|nr:PA2779 family protein [Bacteriovoracaceae bacterium]